MHRDGCTVQSIGDRSCEERSRSDRRTFRASGGVSKAPRVVGRCRPYVAAPFRRGGHGSSEVVSRPRGVGTAPWRGDPRARLAADPPELSEVPQSVKDLRLDQPVTATNGVRPSVLAASLRGAKGTPQAVYPAQRGADRLPKGAANQKAQNGKVNAQQAASSPARRTLPRRSRSSGGRRPPSTRSSRGSMRGRSRKPSRDPAVLSISPVVDYQLDLSETVPYIGGTAVQGMGHERRGHHRRRARLGHRLHPRRVGGPGTTLAYENAYGTKLQHEEEQEDQRRLQGPEAVPDGQGHRRLGLRGRAVAGGHGQPAAGQDPDPIRAARAQSRRPAMAPTARTSRTSSPARLGVAPEATLFAVKVCSSLSTSCSGVALIRGHGFRARPRWRRLHRRPRRHHQHVARLPVRARPGRRSERGRPDGHRGRDARRGLGRQQRRQALHRRLAVLGARRRCRSPRRRSRRPRASRCCSRPAARSPRARPSSSPGPSRSPRPMPRPTSQCSSATAPAATSTAAPLSRPARSRARSSSSIAGPAPSRLKIANIAGGDGAIGVIGLITPGDPFDGSFSAPDCPDNICAQAAGYMVSQADLQPR